MPPTHRSPIQSLVNVVLGHRFVTLGLVQGFCAFPEFHSSSVRLLPLDARGAPGNKKVELFSQLVCPPTEKDNKLQRKNVLCLLIRNIYSTKYSSHINSVLLHLWWFSLSK